MIYDILMSMAGLWLSRCIICFSPLIIETKIAHRFLDSQPIDLRDSFSWKEIRRWPIALCFNKIEQEMSTFCFRSLYLRFKAYHHNFKGIIHISLCNSYYVLFRATLTHNSVKWWECKTIYLFILFSSALALWFLRHMMR